MYKIQKLILAPKTRIFLHKIPRGTAVSYINPFWKENFNNLYIVEKEQIMYYSRDKADPMWENRDV